MSILSQTVPYIVQCDLHRSFLMAGKGRPRGNSRDSVCPVCEDPIVEKGGKSKGQDAKENVLLGSIEDVLA